MVCPYCNPNYGEGHTTHTNHAQVQAPQEIAELLLLLLHKLYFMLSVSMAMEQFHYEPNPHRQDNISSGHPQSYEGPLTRPWLTRNGRRKGFSDPGKQTW